MKILPILRFRQQRFYGVLSCATPTDNVVSTQIYNEIDFQLVRRKRILFYECMHCRGCRCPSFTPLLEDEIPLEIIEHLATHAQLCNPDVMIMRDDV